MNFAGTRWTRGGNWRWATVLRNETPELGILLRVVRNGVLAPGPSEIELTMHQQGEQWALADAWLHVRSVGSHQLIQPPAERGAGPGAVALFMDGIGRLVAVSRWGERQVTALRSAHVRELVLVDADGDYRSYAASAADGRGAVWTFPSRVRKGRLFRVLKWPEVPAEAER